MTVHEVAIHFHHSGGSSQLFLGSAQYRSNIIKTDSIKIYHKHLTIEATRSRTAKDPLHSQEGSFYNQILKCLCLYYILSSKANQIKSISVSVQSANGTMTGISNMHDEIRQVIEKRCNLSSLSNIQPQKADIVLQENAVGKSVLYAATHLIKSLDAQNPVERFERLWRSFNALYRAFAKKNTDNECHRVLRQHIMNNPALFSLSIDCASRLTSSDIRQNTRWIKMILNSCPSRNHANKLAESILRNTDSRILEIYHQTLPVRSAFLASSNRLNDVVSHIGRNITANTISNQDVLATLALRYMYFVRNRIAHAHKVDHGFTFLRENNDHKEAMWLAPMLESLVIDMINISDTF
jgi:hypothetical protein